MDDPERLGYGNATSPGETAIVEKNGGDRVSEDRTTNVDHPRAATRPGEAEAVGDDQAMSHDWEQAKTRILTANTAQGVFKHLRTLESNRSRVLPRWIWELLQNARDVSVGDGSLIASVETRDGELIFRHNGRGFDRDEITHLVYYGSTKLEREDALGQFGSGFLTTHLLCPTIGVSGQLTDGQTFAFPLDRRGDTVAELQRRMDASFEAFQHSLALGSSSSGPGTKTTFRYQIDQRAAEAVEKGVQALERTGAYVAAVNKEFKQIEIWRGETGRIVQLKKRQKLAEDVEVVAVEISAHEDTTGKERIQIVGESDGVTVVVPFERNGEKMSLISPRGVPKLLLGFPLIGTEDFSFPALLHSLRFWPTEERDGVYLGQGEDDANRENQEVVEQGCQLLLSIARLAAKVGSGGIHILAEVPAIRQQTWLNEDWLRACLRSHLVDQMRTTPAVLTESGSAIAPRDARLPTADSSEAIDDLWSLAATLKAWKERLPRRTEAQGWCNAARSWSEIYSCRKEELEETITGRDLAKEAQKAGSIEGLQARLVQTEGRQDFTLDATIWLEGLYRFLQENGLREDLRRLKIIPDQNGRFNELSALHRDQDIPGELKDIAARIDWDLRAKLRDGRVRPLTDEPGAGDLDRDFVITKLIEHLHNRMENQLDDDSKAASVELFGWLAAHGAWRHLDGFPAFANDGTSSTFMKLLRGEDDAAERPLAPVQTWPEPLRQYADLFPGRHILADDYAAGVDKDSVWSALDEKRLLRTSVLYTRKVELDRFLPDEPLPKGEDGKVEHRVDGVVEVTDIAFLTKSDIGMVSRVRQSRKRAQVFWDFLSQWIAVEDAKGLKHWESGCICGSRHRYYPAAWLVPVAHNRWVPLEGRRTDRASAHSLANLVRDTAWHTGKGWERPQAKALLKAVEVSVPELVKELLTTDEQEREAVDETMTQLLTAVGDEWKQLQVIAEDIQEDNEFFEHLEERRRKRRSKARNERVGALVEKLVREILEAEGFDVERTGVGSDWAIQLRATGEDEEVTLELTRRRQRWLVEIKSTRGQQVSMTPRQAETAVEEDSSYLLCVVPIRTGTSEDPDEEEVRRGMRFVENIGRRVAGICTDLRELGSFRNSVTSKERHGLHLDLELGEARVRIDRAVWETGFGLEELFPRLVGTEGGVGGAERWGA